MQKIERKRLESRGHFLFEAKLLLDATRKTLAFLAFFQIVKAVL